MKKNKSSSSFSGSTPRSPLASPVKQGSPKFFPLVKPNTLVKPGSPKRFKETATVSSPRPSEHNVVATHTHEVVPLPSLEERFNKLLQQQVSASPRNVPTLPKIGP